MKLITKGKEPTKLSLHRNSGGTYGDFSRKKGKKETKEQLLEEQNNLCAYCTRAINFGNMDIEHWKPQSIYPQKDLQYSNMLAVCIGKSGKEKEEHCDKSRGNQTLTINPQNVNHINQIYYTKSTGRIQSSNQTHQEEIHSILRLNIPSITKERKTILNTLRIGLSRKYKGKTANYKKELKKWESMDKPHCMVVIQYLEKRINRKS